MQRLISIYSHFINAIFPMACAGCGESGVPLCTACISALPKAREPEYSFITSIFDYREQAIRRAIWLLKYKNVRSVAKCFGEKLYEEILGDFGDSLYVSKHENILIIPVPLHPKRRRARGYNQSELLAREIIKYDSEKVFTLTTNALIRTRETNAQAKKDKRMARFENLKDAFAAKPELVHRRTIILIDDVTTTGATLREARKALLKAGARKVTALTVAH